MNQATKNRNGTAVLENPESQRRTGPETSTGTAPNLDALIAQMMGATAFSVSQDLPEEVAVQGADVMRAMTAEENDTGVTEVPDDDTLRRLATASPLGAGAKIVDVHEADQFLHRLKSTADLLEQISGDNADQVIEALVAYARDLDAVETENYRVALKKQRPVELALRSLDSFYELATSGNRKEALQIRVANVSAAKLAADPKLRKSFELQVTSKGNLSQDKLVSLITVPMVNGLAEIFGWGKYADRLNAIAVQGLKPTATFDETVDRLNSNEMKTLMGNLPFHKRVVVTINDLRIRQPLVGLETEALYISSGVIKAAMIIATDRAASPATPAAGYDRAVNLSTPDGSELVTRWLLDNTETLDRLEGRVIPFVDLQGALTALGASTASENEDDNQYNVVRTLDLVGKVAIHFVNRCLFQENTPANRMQLQDQLDAYLISITGDGPDKMLQSGRVTIRPTESGGRELSDEIDLIFDLEPKFAIVRGNVDLKVVRKQGVWQKKE